MKFMFSPCCGTLVVPSHKGKEEHKLCECGKTACWWEDADAGLFVIWDPLKKATVIGIHNGIFKQPYSSKEIFRELLDKTSDSYLFKSVDSLIIHIRPGVTFDTRYAGMEEHT